MSTLKQVAALAGVSTATVSCCLSGSKAVKAETKAKILEAVEKLKYIPNYAAKSLKHPRSTEIGIILTDISDPILSDIFEGTSSFFQDKNYNISVAFSHNSPETECATIESFIGKSVAGLIIMTCQPENTHFFENRIRFYNIPAVFLLRHPFGIDCNFISFNNYETVNRLTDKLICAGYSRIALISGHTGFTSESDALLGYEEAHEKNFLEICPQLCGITNMSKEDSFKCAMNILGTNQPQAVIATTVCIAKGVLEAARILGVKVSQDMSLFALSEESWNRSGDLAGVTHIPHSAFQTGKHAAQMLLDNIRSPLLFDRQTVLEPSAEYSKAICIPPAPSACVKTKKSSNLPSLRILMAELSTSRSILTLSQNFTSTTGIELHIDMLPQNQMLNRILQDMNHSDVQYDIYMYDIPWLPYLVQSTVLADISDFISKGNFNQDKIFKENMKHCYYRKGCYGIPIVGGSQILFYRKDLFENLDLQKEYKRQNKMSLRPPRTWTEFNNVAKFFTRELNPISPTEYGTSFSGIISEELAPEILIRLWAYDGQIFNSANQVQLNTPQNAKAFHSVLETLRYTNQMPFQTSINDTVEDFCNGKTAMLITYSEYANQIVNVSTSKVLQNVGYEPLPSKSPMCIGWNFGVSALSLKKDIAFKYFEWLCMRDNSYYMTILDGQSTMIAPYHNNELLKLYPWLSLTEKSFPYCHARTGPYDKNALVIPQSNIEEILCDAMRTMYIRGTPVEEALNAAHVKMQQLFTAYGHAVTN